MLAVISIRTSLLSFFFFFIAFHLSATLHSPRRTVSSLSYLTLQINGSPPDISHRGKAATAKCHLAASSPCCRKVTAAPLSTLYKLPAPPSRR